MTKEIKEPEDLGIKIESKEMAYWLEEQRKLEEMIFVGTRVLEIQKMLSEWLKTRIRAIREEESKK